MKKLENKLTNLDGGEGKADYKDMILMCLEFAREKTPEGYTDITVSEMRIRGKLMDIIEGSNGTIEMEDADAEKIKSYVLMRGEMGWGAFNRECVQFEDDVINM